MPTGTHDVRREKGSNWEHCLGGQWVRNERGLAVRWAVWRRSYLNRNTSVAFTGLGPSQVSGGAGRRMRTIVESYDKEWYGADDRDTVIYDGKAASFCQSCTFACFVYRSSSSIPFYTDHSHSIFLSLIYVTSVFLPCSCSLLPMFSHSPTFTVQQSNSSSALSSSAFVVITDEQRFMSPLPMLALLDLSTILSTDT